jgi:hypothetical protein
VRIIAALIIVVGAGPVVAADSAFEVASIRPAYPDRNMSINRAGNRISFSNYSLAMLIEWAYNIRAAIACSATPNRSTPPATKSTPPFQSAHWRPESCI